jgi:hypothetical protein
LIYRRKASALKKGAISVGEEFPEIKKEIAE